MGWYLIVRLSSKSLWWCVPYSVQLLSEEQAECAKQSQCLGFVYSWGLVPKDVDFFNRSFMKIFMLNASYSRLKPNLQCVLQSHLISPFIPLLEANGNFPLVTVMPETTQLFSQSSPLVTPSMGTSLVPAEISQQLVQRIWWFLGCLKGKIIYFQQLQTQRLYGQ